MLNKRIALAGFARTGKDEIGKILVAQFGYVRRCFGDIIKAQVSDLVMQELGFRSDTENDDQKEKIRPLLEAWGDANYDGIMSEFFATLPETCVNTRIVRILEAQEWKRQGGEVWLVRRPGMGAATKWELNALLDLHGAVGFDRTIDNDGDLKTLATKVHSLSQ